MRALEAEVERLNVAWGEREREVMREREEAVAREEELAVGVKRRIEKVKEAAKAQMPVKLKEVIFNRAFIKHCLKRAIEP